MSRIVILAATENEIAGCRDIEGLIPVVTGIGATNTAIATMSAVKGYWPALMIQIGIAGAYGRNLPLGEAVLVASDRQADLGAWRGDRFEAFENHAPLIECPWIPDVRWKKPIVRAQSVNCAASPLVATELAEIETMEGAAFFAAAAECEVKFLQLRTISNYVDTPREVWEVERAIAALPGALRELLDALD